MSGVSYLNSSAGGSFTGGYTCGGCGLWVQYGWIHSCIPRTHRPAQPSPTEVRIAAALERIAAVLEELATKDAA